MIKVYLTAIIALWLSVGGAQVKASATLGAPRIETGDTFLVQVQVTGTGVKPEKVDFSAWQSMLPPENILSERGWKKGREGWVDTFTLIAFDSARLMLPPLSVRLHLGEVALTNALELLVTPTAAPTQASAADPIRDIRREPLDWMDVLPFALAALALAGAGIWYWRRNRTKKPMAPSVPAAPKISPQAAALQRLETLAKQNLWQQGQVRSYYDELTLIVRDYLQQRYHAPALELPTSELLAALRQSADFPPAQLTNLQTILHWADLAKFAKGVPPTDFHEKAFQNAKNLVHA
jgi:hypothetical protein